MRLFAHVQDAVLLIYSQKKELRRQMKRLNVIRLPEAPDCALWKKYWTEMTMIRRFILFYLLVFSIPLFTGLLIWQSNRYQNLEKELARLEKTQTEWTESNKRLIAGIAEYSSPQRIDSIARNELELHRIQPEYSLQVRIMGGSEYGH